MVKSSENDHCRIQTENQILNQKLDFSAAYLAVQYLFFHIKNSLYSINDQTIAALFCVIQSQDHDTRKQAYFLYKEATDALIHISVDISHPFSLPVISRLQDLLVSTSGKKHRAISEALGSLPLKIPVLDIKENPDPDLLELSFDTFLAVHEHHISKPHQWQGRTLLYPLNDGRIVCIKFARSKENLTELIREVEWLLYLKRDLFCNPLDFHVPIPVTISKKSVFKLNSVPEFILNHQGIYHQFVAIAFIAKKEYFYYANEPCHFQDQAETIKEVYGRNAWLLGKLTSMGIIHTAIIPLFHNRVQQSRRHDHGLYVWEQGGRLDKWLESCRYPNFAQSGIRDFEHLTVIQNTRELRHFIGEHLLGFILVMGSFFRNKAPEKTGFDKTGAPLDMRCLFDKKLFKELFTNVVRQYYQGITGLELETLPRFLNDTLIDSLIETMGIDVHMEEILRIRDQMDMSDSDFKRFLISRGQDLVDTIHKGDKDIILNTGPHLGGFNQPMPVPELIDFLFCVSSLCVSDRFITENGLKGYRN